MYCFYLQGHLTTLIKNLEEAVMGVNVSTLTNTWNCPEQRSVLLFTLCGSFLSSPALPANSGGCADGGGQSTKHKFDRDRRDRE